MNADDQPEASARAATAVTVNGPAAHQADDDDDDNNAATTTLTPAQQPPQGDDATSPQHHVVTQVREYREPSATSGAASDQNSTPTRSPSRALQHHNHQHRHHQPQHRQHQHQQPLPPPSSSSSHRHASRSMKVNPTLDDADGVAGGGVGGSPLAKVHRRPNNAPGAQSFSDPTASPAAAARHHHHHHHHQPHHSTVKQSTISSASSASLHNRPLAAATSSAAAAVAATMAAAPTAAERLGSGSSPAHRKRSKSESRRRRERKMIAAGELEVRQANETLMRYLRQCTEINDASLSGELEIDQSYDDRRVHRKTRSQRERRGFQAAAATAGGAGTGGGVTAAGGGVGGAVSARGRLQLQNGLTNILQSLVEDIRPAGGGGGAGGEIYNPFTPVISPSDGAPHMGIGSKIFVQHPHHYRRETDDGDGGEDGFRADGDHGMESHSPMVQNIIDMSCAVQRCWILLSNLCHGLLGGLAFAHLLLVLTTNPFDWLAGGAGDADGARLRSGSSLAHAYASSFYALAVVCLVSVFDRMDFCRLNSSFSEAISFRWIIVLMIYLATNILSLSTEATIEHNDFSITNSTEWLEKMENNRVLDVWNSLSIVRSVCALLGWMLVGMFPHDDLLFDHLAEMERHQLN